ncbi:Mitochondrial-processing peptidase subunit alpha, variant 2 [Entomophthora muscae]|uniref:Mitochondrial-processing peptidase subunit alpha, variant 2 n=1 Tax=Entomophthora muscae TaxID=34485 RepID=A0ACC2RSH5_9FUNG|nr:Mitochondrial-processing peptidase subunit alpha, variant 2 [Entomophthora muscae]
MCLQALLLQTYHLLPNQLKKNIDQLVFPVTARSCISKDPTLPSVSTLDNGIRVVSDSIMGHFSAFGMYVDAGSRYETPAFAGASHILDRIAFKSTENLTEAQIKAQIEKFGGNVMSHSTREVIHYQGTVYNYDLEHIAPLFAEIVRRPLFLQAELDEQKQSTGYEIQEIMSNPETYLPERLHEVAYKNNTLGKPLLCSPETLPNVTSDMLRGYVNQMFVPERIVIAASGAPHDAIVELAQKHFGDMKAPEAPAPPKGLLSSLTNKLFSSTFTPDITKAQYTGGLYLEEAPQEEFTQLIVGLEGVSVSEEDLFPLATLQTLLGGGHSFSAGGPGKGIHSRLYRTVLNRYGWTNSCMAFNHSYRDSGLFGIMGSCPAGFNLDMLHVIGSSLSSVCDASRITDIELSRAKNQLKNNLLMNLESRLTRIEDMGQQVLVTGKCLYASDVCLRIEALTKEDVADVATRLFMNHKNPPSIVGYGQNLDTLQMAPSILAKFGIGC